MSKNKKKHKKKTLYVQQEDIDLLSAYSDIYDLSDQHTVKWLKENFIKENNKMSNWISVKEKLPETNDLVVIYVSFCRYIGNSIDDHNYITIGRYTNQLILNGKPAWVKFYGDETILIRQSDVKYWMPLPEIPEDE